MQHRTFQGSTLHCIKLCIVYNINNNVKLLQEYKYRLAVAVAVAVNKVVKNGYQANSRPKLLKTFFSHNNLSNLKDDLIPFLLVFVYISKYSNTAV